MMRTKGVVAMAALPFRIVLTLACLVRAWATLEPRDWSALADQLARLVAALPALLPLRRAQGLALRSGQRADEAVLVQQACVKQRPDEPALLRDLARSLRQVGRRPEAVAAWQAAASLGHTGAIADLLRQGERAALPVPQPGIVARRDAGALVAANPPTPATLSAALFCIQTEGPAHAGCPLLLSLAQQTHTAWTLDDTAEPWSDLPRYDLRLPSSARLEPDALSWLNYAIAHTGCAVVRADHDHYTPDGNRGDPWLLPRADRLWLDSPAGIARLEARRSNAGAAPASHVPLVLMSLPASMAQMPAALPGAEPLSLSIVIPTRDNPELLIAAITSLRATAHQPGTLEFVIVDNGSITPKARACLFALAQQPGVRIVPFAEAFNWSRASNLGAAAAAADHLLFLNDDTEMRTQAWDHVLAGVLANPLVAAVGARMLYPDGRIQYAGFVFGMDNGPQHDGRWRPGDDAGPAGRWTAIRETVALTGAFIAISRTDFAAVGGFDEQGLAIDYADVDLCLKLRARGRAVAYCGAITLLHHESVSRGLNVSRAKRRRMRREWALMKARWGSTVVDDPFHHPAWVRAGVPHDGLQAVSSATIVDWIGSRPV